MVAKNTSFLYDIGKIKQVDKEKKLQILKEKGWKNTKKSVSKLPNIQTCMLPSTYKPTMPICRKSSKFYKDPIS